jgi:hypothetical protein
MKVYISGPITGMPSNNREAFDDAARRIAALGLEYVNPLELCAHLDPTVATHDDYMAVCLPALRECDQIVVLDGWRGSKGCKYEAHEWNMHKRCPVYCTVEMLEANFTHVSLY